MPIAILTGLLIALAGPLLHRLAGRWVWVPFMALGLGLFGYFCTFLPAVLQRKTVETIWYWVPSLHINLHFYLDGLSLFFALLISGFGALIMLYAGGYLEDHPLLGRFYLYLALFMTAMLGLVLSANIFCLFLFWELTSLSSYLLIGFKHESDESRAAAWQALLVTGGGGLALMGGLLLLGLAGNSFEIPELLNQQELVTESILYVPAMLLILLGCFTKSAQFPFHFWLPGAMAAPTPVSAYLHSATMVKAGIYLLARLTPVLGGTLLWENALMLVGGLTTIVGAFMAFQQTDLKAILAYTTISALGILVMLTGIGTEPALQAMLVFLLGHALYKGTLFLVAGNVDHATGTRDILKLRSLGKGMRFSGLAATLAALSMAGVLPFFGFLGKELLYETALTAGTFRSLLFGIAFFSGVIFVGVALTMSLGLFWRKHPDPTPVPHPEALPLYLPPLFLAFGGLLFGLVPAWLATPLLRQAAGAMLQTVPVFELKLWHGFNLVLGLSFLTLFLGYILYRFSGFGLQFGQWLGPVYRFGPASIYQSGFQGFQKGAKAITGVVQNGYLRTYVATIMLTLILLVVLALWKEAPPLEMSNRLSGFMDFRIYELVLVILIPAALIFLFRTKSRLTAIAILGMIGYAVAIFFIMFGAPDIAATQLLIETLTVVLFVLLLHKLPAFRETPHKQYKRKYLVISCIFGAMVTYVLLLVKQFPLNSDLKAYFGAHSYLLGKGRNIVNVILVDFRALDTLGEIVVLAVAAIGIYAMLKMKLEEGDEL